jgi:hypothetical protein
MCAEVARLREALWVCVDALSPLGGIADMSWSREAKALVIARAALAGEGE